MTFAEKFLKLRKKEGYSQEELAEKLSVSRQAISRWEMGTAVPDSNNLLQISKLFGVSTDYLLRDDYQSDDDIPKVKEKNKILEANLIKVAIIGQAAFLNVAMRSFQQMVNRKLDMVEILLEIVPLLICSVWMVFNLRYEKDTVQRRKNTRIELLYCVVQAAITLFGYYSKQYMIGTVLLVVVMLIYILWINPKYMNRPLTKQKDAN